MRNFFLNISSGKHLLVNLMEMPSRKSEIEIQRTGKCLLFDHYIREVITQTGFLKMGQCRISPREGLLQQNIVQPSILNIPFCIFYLLTEKRAPLPLHSSMYFHNLTHHTRTHTHNFTPLSLSVQYADVAFLNSQHVIEAGTVRQSRNVNLN